MEKGGLVHKWKQLDIHMLKKMNLDTDLAVFTKIHSKWITDLDVNCKNPRRQSSRKSR